MSGPRVASEKREFPARLTRIFSFRDPSKGDGHGQEEHSS